MMMCPSPLGGGSIVRASLLSLVGLMSLITRIIVSGYPGGNLLERQHRGAEAPICSHHLRAVLSSHRALRLLFSESVAKFLVFAPYLTCSVKGSLLSILHYHFDTTTGPKLEAQSYRAMYAPSHCT